MSDISSLVTATRIRMVCPKVRGDILETILTDAPTEFPAFGLVDTVRIAHFFAQIAAETGGLRRLDEDLFYTTAARLRKVFGKTVFPTEDAAKPYLRKPEDLANFVYAGKNGNSKKGDGWTYRGSGLIQLTGRGNFHAVDKLLGTDLEADPEQARHPDSALRVALAYWKARNINAAAGGTTDAAVAAVTKLVNAAMHGLPERKAYFRKGLKAFAAPPTAAAAAARAAPVATPPAALAASPALAAAAPPGAGLQLSGPQWVARFPTSRSIDDLAPPFREHASAFVAALRAAGAGVTISATYRPKERAYLMHWAWAIGKTNADPATVPPMPGVAIQWVHPTLAKSRAAARQMVAGFGMAFTAALNSRHTEHNAIDMTIGWTETLSIHQSNGVAKAIAGQPRNGGNHELIAVGAGYGVIKLPSDPPHWSNDGR